MFTPKKFAMHSLKAIIRQPSQTERLPKPNGCLGMIFPRSSNRSIWRSTDFGGRPTRLFCSCFSNDQARGESRLLRTPCSFERKGIFHLGCKTL